MKKTPEDRASTGEENGSHRRPFANGEIPFSKVVDDHWAAVHRLVAVLAGNPHDADDLTQETFLRALNRLDSFTAGTGMRAWLLRIASNAFFDEQRKRKRARTGPLNGDLPGPAQAPGQALENSERGAKVAVALQKLSELTRLVFHLRAQEDLSFKEIAEAAGTTEQGARWHMHHARTTLLARLGEDF